ncbi:Usp family protein [Metarhizium album ARSEF 1941]|uniref:Usp family protein n=1 Tax=Metarhizium album (strain ARSEF 1941) TaxID=1081103 RepID=A0A0B2X8C7_METAS|nr:Usp family protein [Metarhizium album ARSEF 1941]KHO01745.1 Usp family protein [Metarhizium album ARSEF 1941]
MSGHRPMSIDAMLDMERREVLALLENKNLNTATSPTRMRSSSPYTAAPRSPVRSMLDIEEEPESSSHGATTQAPVRSMLDIDAPLTTTQPPVRSMLDIAAPSPPGSIHGRSSSPVTSNEPVFKNIPASSQGSHHPRSSSDAAFKPADFGPRAGYRLDKTSEYQFSGILPQYSGLAGSKRLSQSGGKKLPCATALGEAFRGADLSSLQLPGDKERNPSAGCRLGHAKSKSPHERWAARSRSPATFAPLLSSNRAVLDDGQVVDISNAYRRLSDANLAFSCGSLAQLPMRKRSDDAGEGRLVKDYLGPDGEHLESSEDDEAFSSDDEDRGRKTAPRSLNPDAHEEGENSKSRSRSGQGDRQTLSLLAAADEERSKIARKQSQTYTYRSLLEPEIKITNSSGDTVKPAKGRIHPNTSYDQNSASATPSMFDSDEEADMDDIKRAQNLGFSMTNILTAPDSHRSIRIIYRGDYHKTVQTADEEKQRVRKYLVATDLSDESTHALEWAIGTVLRDGDTLIAIYCVDEETGIVTGEGSLVPDDPKAMREQAAAINTVTNSKGMFAPVTPVVDLRRASARRADSSGGNRTPGASPAPSQRGDNQRAVEERSRAIQEMTDKILRLLRKTRLQARVIVEVLHCKNPRHMITEVIDIINPTLVVIGSRGRSALKGVILGSFSNYLVTKSSVPVMVARKRLRKQSKYKQKAVKQVNNISNPAARSLANAKID